MRAFKMTEVSAVDKPCQEGARALIIKRNNGVAPLTPAEAFWKLSSDQGAISFCKMIVEGRIDNPFTKATWEQIIEIQALGNYEGCTRAQSVSKYLCSEVGRWLFQAAKAAPLEKAVSTPMDVISDSDARAYMSAATALERGRQARERAAMRPDITPRRGDEEPSTGGASDAHQ